MRGKEVCRKHGGKTPSGIASPHWKHGRYQKVLPTRYLTNYKQAMQDEELLSLKSELAVVQARMMELFGRVDKGDSGILFKRLQDERKAFDLKNKAGKIEEASEHLNEIMRLIQQGYADWATWDEIHKTMQLEMRLIDAERKRLIEMQQMVKSEDVMNFVSFITGLIREYVSDRDEIAAISAAIADRVIQEDNPGIISNS